MICKPDGTYEIEQSDIDLVNTWIYKLLSKRATSGTRTFDLNAFVKYVYTETLKNTQDAQKALVISRQVPTSVDIAINADDNLRTNLLGLTGYSTDAVLNLKRSFSESINAVSDLINKSVPEGKLTDNLTELVNTGFIQPGSEVTQAPALNAEQSKVSDLPYTPLSTTGNESIEGRGWYYGFTKRLAQLTRDNGGLLQDGTTSYDGVDTGVRISMVLGSEIPVDQLYLDLQNQPNIEDIKKDQVFTVVTDSEGNFIYFDENYNVTDETNGKLVYFPTRSIPSFKLENDRKVFNLSEQGDRSVQSLDDKVRGLLAANPEMKEADARDQVENEYQGAYTLLSDAADYLKDNPTTVIPLNLTGINQGTLRFDDSTVTPLSSIKNLGGVNIAFVTTAISDDPSIGDTQRKYLVIPGVSDKVSFSMNAFSLEAANRVADLLVNDVYTEDGVRLSNNDKYKAIVSFVKLGGDGIIVNDKGVTLGGTAIDTLDKATAKAAIVDYLTRSVKVKDAKGDEVEIKNQFWFDSMTYKNNGNTNEFLLTPKSDGTYTITNNQKNYKEWIRDNAYTKIALNSQGEITQVNGYFEFNAAPDVRNTISSRKVEQKSLRKPSAPFSLDGLTAPVVEDKEESIIAQVLKNRKDRRDPGTLFSMRHDSLTATKAQIKRGKKWFDNRTITFKDASGKEVTKKLSDVMPYNELFDVINSNGDIRATWTRNGITLYNGSDYADLYHEAWHGFTQLFLNKEQKTALYNEVKKLKTDIKYYDHKAASWKTINSGDLDFTNRNHVVYAEEYLAEKFRAYSIDKSAPTTKIKSIFQKIWNALKAFFGGSTKESAANPYDNAVMNEAFDKLYTGNLVDYTFDQANVEFGQLNYGITSTEEATEGIQSLDLTDSLAISDGINAYISEFIDLAVRGKVNDKAYGNGKPNSTYGSLILTNPIYKADALDYAKKKLEEKYDVLADEYQYSFGYQKNAIAKQMASLAFAIDNFGDLDNLSNNKKGTLSFFNSQTGFLDLTVAKEGEDTVDIGDRETDDPAKQVLSAGDGNELSGLDRMDSILKFALSNIIQRERKVKADDLGIKLNNMGLYATADPRDMFNMIRSITENLNDRSEMYDALNNKSKEVENGQLTPMALMIKQFLNKVGEPNADSTGIAQLFWNKVYIGFRTDRLSSLQNNININQYGNFEVIVGKTDSSASAIKRDWLDRFKYKNPSSYTITDPTTNETYLDLKALNDKYKDIKKISEINPFEFFKDFGIEITPTVKNLKAIKDANIIGDLLFFRLKKLMQLPATKVVGLESLLMTQYPYKEGEVEKKIPGQAKVFNKLLDLETIANPKYTDYMRVFAGDARSELSNPSGVGNTIIALNKARTFDEVISRPELSRYNPLKNPQVKTSVIFNKMFNLVTGERNVGTNLDYQSVLGTQLLDKRKKEVGDLLASVASAESDEQTAYLRDFFFYSLHGAGEAFRHADKNMAYIVQLQSNTNFYIKPELFAEGAGVGNKGRQEANKIITGYIASELERIKKVLKSKSGELIGGEKASDIILYTSEPIKDKDGLVKEVTYTTLEDVGIDFTIFDDILTPDLKAELINNKDIQTVEDFQKLLSNNKQLEQRIHGELNDYFTKLVKEDRNKLRSYSIFNGSNLAKSLKTIKDRSFSKINDYNTVLDASILHFTYASFIHKHEMSTLVYGDPVMYNHEKDEHMKRIGTFFATGRIPVSDDVMEEWLQKNPGGYYKSNYFTNSGLIQPANNEIISRVLPTAVFEDAIESISEKAYNQMVAAYIKNNNSTEKIAKAKYKNYKNMKSADAQGWISFDAYRAIEIRLDNWSPAKEQMYRAVLRGEIIDPDVADLFFPIKKMQYAGPLGSSNFAINAVHKYSLMPLIPTIIQGTELEKLHNKMVSQNIAYSVMHSGSKVANMGATEVTTSATGETVRQGKLNKFYTEPNGDHTLAFDSPDYKFVSNQIYLDYFKEQLVTHDTAKNKVKFPTQKRALVTSGLSEFGIPTDFNIEEADDDKRLAAWNALVDKDGNPDKTARLKASKAYGLKQAYIESLKNLFETASSKLKMELGYKDPDSTKKVGKLNVDKLMNFVKEQLTAREALSEYQLDFLDIGINGELIFPQDLGANPAQIEKLISSLVNKKITDQVSRGESFIQASSVGFRKTQLKTDDSLLFYRQGPNGTTLPMQVKIPLIGDFTNLLNYVDTKGKKIGTIARLNELIKDEEWLNTGDNRKMITMGGDRIPIQGHNSMEIMEVAEFFDPAGGNMMVLPLEIVAKTGGDFDIDKLICLIPVIKNNLGVVELSKPVKTRKLLKTIVAEKQKLQEQLKGLRKKYIKGELTPEFKEEIAKLEEEQKVAQDAFNNNYVNDYYVGGSVDKYFNVINSTQQAIDNLYEQLAQEKIEVYQGKFDKYIDESSSITAEIRELNRQQDSYEPSTYQNEVMESMNDILLREDNFTNLTLPNDTDTYTEEGGLVDTFTEVNRPYDRKKMKTSSTRKKMSPTRIMENAYNNNKAFALSAGKSGVSMGAKTNKIYSSFKEVGLYMEPVYKAGAKIPVRQRLLVKSNTIPVGKDRAISLGHARDIEGKDISDQISQLMNGYLDVAKEDWVFDINAVKEVEPEFLFLLQAGTGPKTASAILSQPLVKRYINAIRKRNNPFSMGASEDLKSLSFAKYDALLEVLDQNLPEIFNYANAKEDPETGRKKTPSNVTILSKAQAYLANQENFDVDALISNSKKGPDGEITEYDKKIFAHFIEIMDLTKGDNELKNSIDIDTKKQQSGLQATQKISALENLSGRFPQGKITQLLDDTYLNNFKTQDLMLSAISEVLPLRGLSTVNEYVSDLLRSKKDLEKDERENYGKHFINDLVSYMSANSIPALSAKATSYKGRELQKPTEIKNQTLLKFGAIKVGDNLLVDQIQIDQDFNTKAFFNQGYGQGLLALLPPTTFSGYSNETAKSLYRAFVYEREIARDTYPYESIESNAEFKLFETMRLAKNSTLTLPDIYEEFIRNKGLYNAGFDIAKFASIPSFGMFSMGEVFIEIIAREPDLKRQYPVLDQLVVRPDANNRFITLSRKIKDVNLQSAYTAQLLDLMNPNSRKTANEGFNQAISSFFAKLPEVAFAQAGNNDASGLYIGSIIYPKQIAVAQADNLNAFIKALKDPAAAKAILDDYTRKFEAKAPYNKKFSYINYNSNSIIPAENQTVTVRAPAEGPGSETKINIYAGTGENAELSNFANRPFILGDGTTYPTVEHAYQLEKLQYSKAYTEDQIDTIVEDINKKSAAQAKAFGRTVKGLDTKKWEEDSSSNMKMLIKSSFEQNPDALAKLLATGNATLTHTQDKGKWGTEFPKLLMEVRNELSPTQTVIPVSTPAQNSKMPNQFLMVPRGPQELVDYETGEVFKVGRVYNQAKLMVNNVYSLSEVQAAEIMNSDPNLVYAFDAARPQAWRVGLATGQSFGITGRTAGNTNPTDAQFEEVKPVIDQQIEVLKAMRDAGKEILFPSDGIGQNFMGYKVQNGVYVLDTNAVKSPQIFVYLSKQLLENFGYRNPNFEQVGLILEDPGQSGLDYIQEFYKTKEGAQDITDREVREYIKNCKNIG